MKTTLLPAVIISAFTSCKPVAFLESPNDLEFINGTLYLANGQTEEGKLSVKDWSNLAEIRLPGERKARRYPLGEVQGYRIRNEYYQLMEINDGISLSRRIVYVL